MMTDATTILAVRIGEISLSLSTGAHGEMPLVNAR